MWSILFGASELGNKRAHTHTNTYTQQRRIKNVHFLWGLHQERMSIPGSRGL